jgi:dipeptidyl aminopeptidase/acylaminoacyl peptidase
MLKRKKDDNVMNKDVIMQYYSKVLCICGILLLISCKQGPNIERVENNISSISIKGLKNRIYDAKLSHERELQGTDDYTADLMSYYSDNLKVYTLINTPTTEKPKNGFPILIFGHGFHPEPKKYGVSTETGKNWRPGDYYRGIPEAYAENGYLVITPDYRGHNISDGFEYTKTSYLASTFYAIDVLNLISTLNQLDEGNIDNVFYLGHSMGGDVGLKTLLASKQIKAASIWAGVSASTLEQALYYGKFYEKENIGTTNKSMNNYTNKLNEIVNRLGFEYDIDSGDPINYLQDIKAPIILHHARGDKSVPYQWSESLASKLFKYNKKFELYAYDSKNHLLKDENRNIAIQRDLDFFNKIKTTKINKNGN